MIQDIGYIAMEATEYEHLWMVDCRAKEKEGNPRAPQIAFPTHTHQQREYGNNSSFVCQLAFKAIGMSLLDLSGKLVKLY